MTLALAAGLSLLLTGLWVQLASRLGWGKSVRRDGPASHLVKEGTPTMGGVAFLGATAVVWIAAWSTGRAGGDELAVALLVAAAAAFGLLDDLASLRRKHRVAAGEDASTGMLARYRLLAQTALALPFALYAAWAGHAMTGLAWLDVLLFTFVVVGAINALNFSDGLDGLAGGMTAIMLLPFLTLPLAAALAGSLLGFLWYNARPARTFMGGVGSEALGAAVAGIAIVSGWAWYLPLIALLPVLMVLSVVLQVTYFRITGGRRLLKMSPLHHHLELSGWSEGQIVTRFWLATALLVAIAASLRSWL